MSEDKEKLVDTEATSRSNKDKSVKGSESGSAKGSIKGSVKGSVKGSAKETIQ